MKKISVCNKICKECGFTKNGTKNTLYYETIDMFRKGMLFPCHMELKAVSGDESYGVEMLEEIKVCRGYVAFMAKHNPVMKYVSHIWRDLLNEVDSKELDNILEWSELFENHEALRNGWELGNNG